MSATTLADVIGEMVDGAVECALWLALDAITGEAVDARGEDVPDDVRELLAEELAGMVQHCADDVRAYLRVRTAQDFGHDFMLTRNGHGAGFWDRGLGALGDRLTDITRPHGDFTLACDDEGTVSLY